MRKNLILLLISAATLPVCAQQKKPSSAKLHLKVAAVLDTVYDDDQRYRLPIESVQKKYGANSRQMDSLWEHMADRDSVDLEKVEYILGKYGWLGPDEVGGKASMAIFLVIQHSDSLTQVTYLPMMREAVQKGKARSQDLALLEDRVLCEQGKGQLYGSQVRAGKDGKYAFFPIADEANVNKRRAAIGMEPLESYAGSFGFVYHLPAPAAKPDTTQPLVVKPDSTRR